MTYARSRMAERRHGRWHLREAPDLVLVDVGRGRRSVYQRLAYGTRRAVMAVIETPLTYACGYTYRLEAPEPADADGGLLADLRRDFRGWLGDHHRSDDAVIVAMELVTNALEHGSAPGQLVMLVAGRLADGGLAIDVTDSGRADAETPCLTTLHFGQGLQIVERLCRDVQITNGVRGWHIQAALAPVPPEIVVPDVDIEALLAGYDDTLAGGPPGELGGENGEARDGAC